ncbi:hypothetical protein JHK82_022808 [Glycine max]|uniref:Uncharacterized protein n=1 Tax=Glycine max TaxID=3847 RepID=K7L9H0_SOYBN|nr:hypothetical protein JHK87_022726 [Glycine soja]KAG5017179.1 hypothetical protein JHK85_023315 [Glycine max]KAG5026936.1 hypothetical protein JHK86_022850 [Glycine max]KAG5138077.1 hypothetical protein JHK82_022808 [Glycine max]KAH1053521.1 hypothetical protein GYH30_022673 [Glycine max]
MHRKGDGTWLGYEYLCGALVSSQFKNVPCPSLLPTSLKRICIPPPFALGNSTIGLLNHL